MVTMSLPTALLINVTQLRVAAPLTCTVQAPQSPMPHPYLVPVSCSRSRRYHNSGISGSPSNARSTPLTLHWIMVSPPCRYVSLLDTLLPPRLQRRRGGAASV